MRTLLLKLLAWAITLLLKMGKERIERVLKGNEGVKDLDEAETLSWEPLAEKLIEMDAAGDFARVDAALKRLRDRLNPTVGDGSGQ